MSTWDLFADGFPHGTPTGFVRGCKGGNCPAGIEHGLTCARAKQLAAGDYRYQKLAAGGATPAQIAAALAVQPVHHEATTDPDRKRRAIERELVGIASPQLDSHWRKPKKPVVADDTDEPIDGEDPIMSTRAEEVPPSPATIVKGAKPEAQKVEWPDDAADQEPRQKRKSPTGPTQGEVRAWAHANGVEVNQRGTIRKDVVDAYLAANAASVPVEDHAPKPAKVSKAVLDVLSPAVAAVLTQEAVASVALDGETIDVGPVTAGEPIQTEDVAAIMTAIVGPRGSQVSEIVFDETTDAWSVAIADHDRDVAQGALAFVLQEWAKAKHRADEAETVLRVERGTRRLTQDLLNSAEYDLKRAHRTLERQKAHIDELRARKSPWWKRWAS